MKRFVEGDDRSQSVLFPECLDDYIDEDHPVRVIDVFVDGLDLCELGFAGVEPAATGRPAYHPATLLKIYIYGYLNRVQSSRRLEREAQRNAELIWLTGRCMPDFKTIANFRKDHGAAIRRVCSQFVLICRRMKLFTEAVVAIDGSKFKAVNSRDKNLTQAKLKARLEQLESSVARYLAELDRAGLHPMGIAPANRRHPTTDKGLSMTAPVPWLRKPINPPGSACPVEQPRPALACQLCGKRYWGSAPARRQRSLSRPAGKLRHPHPGAGGYPTEGLNTALYLLGEPSVAVTDEWLEEVEEEGASRERRGA